MVLGVDLKHSLFWVMTKEFEVYELILRLSRLFMSKCAVCHRKCTTGKHFTIHHIKYNKKEKTYKDFEGDRLAYYKYLFPLVKRNKKRFALLCNTCHQAVTKLSRWGPEKRRRLYVLTRKGDKQ